MRRLCRATRAAWLSLRSWSGRAWPTPTGNPTTGGCPTARPGTQGRRPTGAGLLGELAGYLEWRERLVAGIVGDSMPPEFADVYRNPDRFRAREEALRLLAEQLGGEPSATSLRERARAMLERALGLAVEGRAW